MINSTLASSDAERKNAIKQGNAVFAFTLKNKAGETESWNLDLRTKGEVTKGLGDKPTGASKYIYIYFDIERLGAFSSQSVVLVVTHLPPSRLVANPANPPVTLALSDDDFGKLVAGKANAQRLFMSGKLKVKGDVMKATKLEPILAKSRPAVAKL